MNWAREALGVTALLALLACGCCCGGGKSCWLCDKCGKGGKCCRSDATARKKQDATDISTAARGRQLPSNTIRDPAEATAADFGVTTAPIQRAGQGRPVEIMDGVEEAEIK